MKVFLMHRDRDLDQQQKLPWNEQALIQDLELNTLFNAMALGDSFLFDVAKHAVLSGINNDLDTILYRQKILKDCLKNPAIIRNIYDIAVELIEYKKKHYFGIFSRSPSSILYSSLEMMKVFVGLLKKLKAVASEHAEKFESEGFTAFFAMLKKELDDEYFAGLQNHLTELKFRDGVLISAELGKGNEGANYILRKSKDIKKSWIERFLTLKNPLTLLVSVSAMKVASEPYRN